MDTRTVVRHHIDVLGQGDLEAVLSDYTDASVIVTPAGSARGLAALRAFFENVIEGFFPPGAHTFTLDEFLVEGEIALTVWRLENEAITATFGTDTFVVRDGRIITQTATFKTRRAR